MWLSIVVDTAVKINQGFFLPPRRAGDGGRSGLTGTCCSACQDTHSGHNVGTLGILGTPSTLWAHQKLCTLHNWHWALGTLGGTKAERQLPVCVKIHCLAAWEYKSHLLNSRQTERDAYIYMRRHTNTRYIIYQIWKVDAHQGPAQQKKMQKNMHIIYINIFIWSFTKPLQYLFNPSLNQFHPTLWIMKNAKSWADWKPPDWKTIISVFLPNPGDQSVTHPALVCKYIKKHLMIITNIWIYDIDANIWIHVLAESLWPASNILGCWFCSYLTFVLNNSNIFSH